MYEVIIMCISKNCSMLFGVLLHATRGVSDIWVVTVGLLLLVDAEAGGLLPSPGFQESTSSPQTWCQAP